jgi:hypothetical protein
MTTLHIYGDSYCNNGFDIIRRDYSTEDSFENTELNWAVTVAQECKFNYRNLAVSGGSTETAILRFTNDVENNVFASGDKIIFQTSTPGRLHFQFQNARPETAASYWFDVDLRDTKHSWYRQNQRHLRWYIENFDHEILVVNHNSYIQYISNFAKLRPDLTIMILQNTIQKNVISHPESTKNFTIVPIALFTVSTNEFRTPYQYNDWISKIRYDARVNHLSINNAKKLAELTIEFFNTGSTTNFTYEQFEQKIFAPILTKDDYYYYVNRKLIHDRSWILDKL